MVEKRKAWLLFKFYFWCLCWFDSNQMYTKMIKLPSLFLFILFFGEIFAQTSNVKIYSSVSYKNLSELELKTKLINHGNELLLNLNLKDQTRPFTFNKDSIFCSKGISSFSLYIKHQLPLTDTNILELNWYSVKNELIKTEHIVLLPKLKTVLIENNDSSILVSSTFNEKFNLEIIIEDSIQTKKIRITHDTSLFIADLINQNPLLDRTISFELESDKNDTFNTVYYHYGKFKSNKTQPIQNKQTAVKSQKKKILSGNIYLENNSFSSTPEHANGLQYPNTIVRLTNTIDAFGIPLRLNFSHNTSDAISPDFKNFFSLGLDVNQFRNKVKDDLIQDKNVLQYDLKEIQPEINQQELMVSKLKETKDLLLKYPNSNYNIDSLYKEEIIYLVDAEKIDSAINSNDSIGNQQPIVSTNIKNLSNKPDSIDDQIARIDKLISRYENSIETKEKFLENQKSYPNDFDQEYPKEDLYKYYEGNPIQKLLLRFDKLQLGNFYEYAGEYSIRDIEIFGINTDFQINTNNSIQFLTGKINDFQSFNLDNSANQNKRISSFAFSNSQFDYLNYSIRTTYSNEKYLNAEIPTDKENYVITALFQGNALKILNYELEINKSNGKLDRSFFDKKKYNEDMAIKSYLSVSPMKQIDFEFSFDKVGSNYFSDGVYFLRRNVEELAFATKVRLFKNKIIARTEYSILKRNVEQKEVSNETDKWFFDVSSRFKRIPNFQIIHSPVTVDIANKLDTTFSNLNAFSTITLTRIYYLKRIKRTFINTSFIYNEITNDIFNEKQKQNSSQFSASVYNKKMSITSTASFFNLFNQFRFISFNYTQSLKEKLRNQLYVSKNINNISPYNWIIRNKIDYQISDSFTLGAGGIFLIANSKTQVGSTVSLQFRY